MDYRFCHNCGTKVLATAKFCGSCGTPLKRPPAQEIAPEVAPECEPEHVPVSQPVAEPVVASAVSAPSRVVFTLDNLDAPIPPVEKVKPSVVFTLDSLPADVPTQPEPVVIPEPAPVVIPEPEPVVIPEPQAPVPPASVAQPQTPTVSPAKPRPRKGILARRGAVRTIFSVLICILLFCWSFVTLAGFNVRLVVGNETSAATLEDILRNVDLTQVPASLMISNLQDPDASLAQWMVNSITAQYPDAVPVDNDDLKEFMEDSSAVAFLAQQICDYISDIANGKTEAMVTVSEMQYQLTQDSDLIYDIFGVDLTVENIEAIAEAAVNSGAMDLFNAEVLREDNAQLFRIAQIALSWWVIAGLGLVLLVLILLLAAAEGSVLRTCGDTGITLMVSSGLWGAAGLFAMLLPRVWNSMLYAIRPIGQVAGALLEAGLIPAAVVFGAGTVLVLIRVVGKLIAVHTASKR